MKIKLELQLDKRTRQKILNLGILKEIVIKTVEDADDTAEIIIKKEKAGENDGN